MRSVSCLQGPEELEKLKKYAADSLNNEERSFIQTMDKKVKAYINEESDDFLIFNEIVELACLWKKYQHLKPFVFLFDPEKTMPEVFQNRVAFIIWAVWRAFHLLGEEDLRGAALSAAKVLCEFQPPYLPKVKEEAVRGFAVVMVNTGYLSSNDLSSSFWEEKIFPYLEGIWEFKWELKS